MGNHKLSITVKQYLNFEKRNGIAPYIWTVLCILPFYFIVQSTTLVSIIGISLTLLFFLFFRLANISNKGWTIYLWTILLNAMSIMAIYLYSYVYFAFFLAYLIGNIRDRIAFFILYFIHLLSTTVMINYMFAVQEPLFIRQLPFIIIVLISIILLPFNLFNRNEKEKLEEKLEDANKMISELIKVEERERIARDLHDTLGQKLSLIGLKSELANKLIKKDPKQASQELQDVQQTARTALSEVRKMVSQMRSVRLKDELVRVKQLLQAAEIESSIDNPPETLHLSLISENILSMCLKEGINNVVKHSGATICHISIEVKQDSTILNIMDNGRFKQPSANYTVGYGIIGMRERLEFINGKLELFTQDGTNLKITVPSDARGGESS
ncbi:sensor histidine kinase [Alkalihalobacillus trypoxylicola]|uniref:histidine kinase n=1 Tax=Alkalihalobacillus trypoxylicola TaxID=519424 RepID=A0A162F472_9BACI|nr:sensor histidine kinase [Alkalihalobacillus trypoxylicola]KYG34771.1 histidine kinase [Alkalihalobacillus trypoxylicola]